MRKSSGNNHGSNGRADEHSLIDTGARLQTGSRSVAAVLCSREGGGTTQLVDTSELTGRLMCKCGAPGRVVSFRAAGSAGALDLEEGFLTIPLSELDALLPRRFDS
jgi:hypothetical protein